jgi:hypothetical protein
MRHLLLFTSLNNKALQIVGVPKDIFELRQDIDVELARNNSNDITIPFY